MIDHDQERALVDALANDIMALSDSKLEELVAALADGKSPYAAALSVGVEFGAAWAVSLAMAMGELHGVDGAAKLLEPLLAMDVGDAPLSRRLHLKAQETASIVSGIVRNHLRQMQNARQVAIEIYEGYGRGGKLAIDPAKVLPKYLRQALLDDGAFNQAMLTAGQLRTPALKAGYLQALDAVGTRKLNATLKTAFAEKMRYFATRIAVTELHREYAMLQGIEYDADDDLEFVQWRLSQRHPQMDICDLYAKQDRFGLGAGIYPKGQAPQRPAHPFCLCQLVKRLDLTGAKARDKPWPEAAYLRKLGIRDAARVAGSRARLEALMRGNDAPVASQRATLKINGGNWETRGLA